MNSLRQGFSGKICENLNSHNTENLQPVIVKGVMAFPEVLKYEKIIDNFIVLVGKSGKTRMKLKVKYAYCYDEKTFLRLKNAFDPNDTERLSKEWQQAKPIVLS